MFLFLCECAWFCRLKVQGLCLKVQNVFINGQRLQHPLSLVTCTSKMELLELKRKQICITSREYSKPGFEIKNTKLYERMKRSIL